MQWWKSEQYRQFQRLILFIVCENQDRSAQVCDLSSNTSLFVSQLKEYKLLTLRTHDLFGFFFLQLTSKQ